MSSRPQSAKHRQSSPPVPSRPQSAKNNNNPNSDNVTRPTSASSRPTSAQKDSGNNSDNELKSALKSSRSHSMKIISTGSGKEDRPQSAKNVTIDENPQVNEPRESDAEDNENDPLEEKEKPVTDQLLASRSQSDKNIEIPIVETSESRPQSAQSNSNEKENIDGLQNTQRTSRPSSAIRRPTSAQNTDRPPSAKKDEITVIVRPFSGDWQMGEDWPVTLSFMATFVDLKLYIEEEKGISANRMQIKLKGKLLTATREKWTLRRMGVYEGYVIHLEPTLPGSWWWNDYSYYVELLLTQIEKCIDEHDGGIFYTDLLPLVQIPLPIKVSLRVFIRSYPDRLHVHCNIVEGTYWIEKVRSAIDLPTFSTFHHNLGKFPYANLPPFDWDSYKDIDDKYKIEPIELGHDKLLDKGKDQKKKKGKRGEESQPENADDEDGKEAEEEGEDEEENGEEDNENENEDVDKEPEKENNGDQNPNKEQESGKDKKMDESTDKVQDTSQEAPTKEEPNTEVHK